MTEIAAPDRSVPAQIQEEVSRLETEAILSFNIRRFDESRRSYRQMLQAINQAQRRFRRPIHKGTPLHMIGLCYMTGNQHNQALRYFALAYVEDALSAGFNLEDEAERLPAARMLRDYYSVRMAVLTNIKQVANETKRDRRWSEIYRPEELLNALETRMGVEANNLMHELTQPPPRFPRRQPFGFPQLPEQRVFIGGGYVTHMSIIRQIERLVNSLGYTPIVAFDVDIPRENTHHYTMLLLHTCGHAIFEISSAAGQLMEIERALNYGTMNYGANVLLLFSETEPGARPSALVTSMLQTAGLKMEGYWETPEIDGIVREFLARR